MDLADVVRRRRMTREFEDRPVDREVILRAVELATWSPSAGKTQGWHLIALEGEETLRYWDVALPAERRASFAFPGLLRAPVLLMVCADPRDYLARYSEPDKSRTGLGGGLGEWPAPYWTIDAAFATMTILLALEDEGLGALFFAHANEEGLRRTFGVPDEVEVLGVIATGHPLAGRHRPGRSAGRTRRGAGEVIRWSRW